MEVNTQKKVLILSVGGSPAQTASTLKKLKEIEGYTHIIFFCSCETLSNINEALLLSDIKIGPAEITSIVIMDVEDMSSCFRELLREIPKKIAIWKCNIDNTIVDFTGGTKVMSSMLVLATIKFCNNYYYMGGTRRTKGGQGTVEDGSEASKFRHNPWNEMAMFDIPIIDSMFENARYSSAIDILEKSVLKVDESFKRIYRMLIEIIKGYNEWEYFRYKEAKNIFEKYKDQLYTASSTLQNKELDEFLEVLTNNLRFLSEILQSQTGKEINHIYAKSMAIDMISNATRRAKKEGKYDDAVIRLYSSIEKYFKTCLLAYGIDNSKAKLEDIPECIRASIMEGCSCENKIEGDKILKFGLLKTFQVLSEFDDNFKKKSCLLEFSKAMKDLMSIRNDSILVHGTTTITKNAYEVCLKSVLFIIGLTEEDIINFPKLRLDHWLVNLLIKNSKY